MQELRPYVFDRDRSLALEAELAVCRMRDRNGMAEKDEGIRRFFDFCAEDIARQRDNFGYFGNLNDEHIESIKEKLRFRWNYAKLSDFKGVRYEFEDLAVKVFYLKTDILNAPEEGFIWARKRWGQFEIYFSSKELIDRFRNEFKQGFFSIAIRMVTFHEYQEVVLGKSHQVAHDKTKERFLKISRQLDNIFPHEQSNRVDNDW